MTDSELDTQHMSANKADMLSAVRVTWSRETSNPEDFKEMLPAKKRCLSLYVFQLSEGPYLFLPTVYIQHVKISIKQFSPGNTRR